MYLMQELAGTLPVNLRNFFTAYATIFMVNGLAHRTFYISVRFQVGLHGGRIKRFFAVFTAQKSEKKGAKTNNKILKVL